MPPLNPTEVISGTHCAIYDADGNWLSNAISVEATVEIEKEEIRRAGSRWVGQKVIGLTGSGNISGYKVTHELAKKIAQVANYGSASFVTELVAKINDPDAPKGKTRIRLKNVQFDSIPLINYEVGSILEEETPFTFSEFEYLE
jgi:Phage tail tube protein